MKRCAIAFFYDPAGIVDEYYTYLLKAYRPSLDHLIVVVNGKLNDEGRTALLAVCDDLIVRDNSGFDVWAYKTGLEYVWEHYPDTFDEVLMFNHTFYGPLYPAGDMFSTMEKRECDFWGITAHKKEIAKTPDGDREIPFHLNSHFIAVRKPMLTSEAFIDYWRNMAPIKSYWESIDYHELRFTPYFQDKKFVVSSYVDPEKFGTAYAAFMEIDATIAAGSPLLKRRAFFHDSTFLDERAVDLPRALRLVEECTDYDTGLIWKNILRSTPARVLFTNTARLRVLPDMPQTERSAEKAPPKIAVCVHAYYADLIDEILDYTANIGVPYDFIVTTDTPEKKKHIEDAAAKRKGIGNVIVRLWRARGRDMSSLLIVCRDLFEGDRYDLVCRIHTKKSPQVGASQGNFFKRFVLENTLNSPGYVDNIVDLFEREPQLGIAMPPMMHISTPTLGHAWFVNKENTMALASRLGLKVPIDQGTPIAPYGGMFWFRPKALRKLFAEKFTYEDFEPEPIPVDGTLAHALERIIVYVAQDAGYYSMAVSAAKHIEYAYAMLEFKANELAARLPTGDFAKQLQILNQPLSFQGDVDARNAALQQADLLRQVTHSSARTKRLASKSKLRVTRLFSGDELRSEISMVRSFFKKLNHSNPAEVAVPSRERVADYLLSNFANAQELWHLFDGRFYTEQNPDIIAAGLNPLYHFIRFGWAEGRSPHPVVDLGYIRQKEASLMSAKRQPMLDLVAPGTSTQFDPHIFFDTRYYLSQISSADLNGMSPLGHYLTRGAGMGLNPHEYFDSKFYMEHSPEIAHYGMNPLVHYVRYGGVEGRPPCPRFDGKAYLAKYPDVHRSGHNPLFHYLTWGRHEGRTV